MSPPSSRDGAPRTGLEGLIDPVDLEASGRDAPPSAVASPPLRRDLHLIALGAIALMATVVAGSALLSPSPGDPTVSRVSPPVIAPGPSSTAELDAAIRDQSSVRGEPLPPPAMALPPAGGERSPGLPLPPLPAGAAAPGSAQAGLRLAESDPLREARLADEAERRRADVLSSPVLAIAAGARAGAAQPDWPPSFADRLDGPPLPPGPPALPAPMPAPGGAVALTTGRAAVSAQLARGTVLPAVLLTEVRSDLPGTLVAQVTQTVWDTVQGDRVLVPQGARLLGEHGSDLRPGRERLLAVFTRLVWPDGRVLDLGRLSAVDAQGRGGLADRVDTRFAQRFGAGFLVAGLATLLAPRERQPATVVVVPVGNTAVSGLGAAAGTVLVETARAILDQQRNAPPLVIVRQGHRFNVIVQDDLPVTPSLSAGVSRAPAAEGSDVAALR